jgi:hypothetical protein
MLASSALAQQPDPGHPRINQVENRLDGQENNTMNADKNGKLTADQAARDERQDQRIQNQLTRDESKHHGHITKREERRLNREMNKEKREKIRQERRDAHKAHHKAKP